MTDTKPHSPLVDDLGVEVLAVECGVTVYAVLSWKQRGRIPAPHWVGVERVARRKGRHDINAGYLAGLLAGQPEALDKAS